MSISKPIACCHCYGYHFLCLLLCTYALESKIDVLSEKVEDSGTSWSGGVSASILKNKAEIALKDLKKHRAYFLVYWPLAIKYTMVIYDKLSWSPYGKKLSPFSLFYWSKSVVRFDLFSARLVGWKLCILGVTLVLGKCLKQKARPKVI